jgi:preprotein translocase subunit SecE
VLERPRRAKESEAIDMVWVNQVREFFKDARVELTKVSWPSRQELWDSTIVVIATVILVSVFVYIADMILRSGVGLLFR